MKLSHSESRLLKIRRLRKGGAPRTLELCSGAGGLSLGLSGAGFELSAHVELDPEAARTYALNFGHGRFEKDPWSQPRNMVQCSASELVSKLDMKEPPEAAFDVLAAGLPCQAFARIGRSKLRAVSGGANDAFQKDPRAALYTRFLEYVEDVQPLAILIENVPDILNFGGRNVPEEICDALDELGYRSAYTLLNAVYYGVPQIRERLFVIAFANELDTCPRFPAPIRNAKLPIGYEGSRRVALKHVNPDSPRYHPVTEPSSALPAAVSVREALADLPIIKEHLTDPSVIRKRKLADLLPYRAALAAKPSYSQTMRSWEGFATADAADGHLIRLTPRDFPIFSAMKPGDDYPKALRVAERRFEQELTKRGLSITSAKSKAVLELRAAMVPPYDPDKFPNKWWKLDPEKPSRTLTAHMGKDTYSHIHFDNEQKRTVSVREAARLQSFPDGFVFAGAMNAAFRQIGNAVPPLLGLAVATQMREQLEEAARTLRSTRKRAA
jgi:DNA (cytosine-5)-methyltransferase 1